MENGGSEMGEGEAGEGVTGVFVDGYDLSVGNNGLVLSSLGVRLGWVCGMEQALRTRSTRHK
jgi:hypothetical protein